LNSAPAKSFFEINQFNEAPLRLRLIQARLGRQPFREMTMLKMVAAGVTALLLSASPVAYAQASSDEVTERLGAADLSALTDARINIVKAALQLTPDQEKYWPPIEDAIRARAKDRESRIAAAAARRAEIRDRSLMEILRDRDPITFMNRRADALAQRSADLKSLADAWRPLYQSLTPDQKRRMAFLMILVVREMRSAVEQRRIQSAEEDDEE
jgi:hypothetical protein